MRSETSHRGICVTTFGDTHLTRAFGLPLTRAFGLLVATVMMISVCGCEPPPRPPIVKKKPKADRLMRLPAEEEYTAVQTSEGDLPLRFASEAPFELWEAHFLGGKQIGYAHLQAELTDRNDEVRYRYVERMQILRDNQMFDSEMSQTSIENLYGRLKQFDAVLLTNSQKITASGTVNQEKLNVLVRRNGEEETRREVSWKPFYGGLMAVQQHLREKPMVRGDKRELTMLAPVIYTPATLKLEAIGMASVSMLSGENKSLLEIEVTPTIENTDGPKTTLWADDKGNILKQYISTYGLIIIRTDRETATQSFSSQHQSLTAFRIPLDKSVPTPGRLARSVFLVRSKSGRDLSLVVKDQPGQLVRVDEQGQFQVGVVRDDAAELSSLQPNDEDRRPGPLVQSDDPLIKEIAAVATPDKKAILARKLARTVFDHIEQKVDSEGFASAAFVASSGRGDCTEHAVMLAALCRAKGIPARVAAGLVYEDTPDGPAMKYHMWTLAYADDSWVHLDATVSTGLAAADRILIATDNLASGNEYAVVHEVEVLLGDLEIKMGKTKYGEEPEPLPTVTPQSNGQEATGDAAKADNPEGDEASPESAPPKQNNPANSLEEILKGIGLGDGGK